jgi:hypothetical protein
LAGIINQNFLDHFSAGNLRINATGSLALFENKKIFYFEKRSILPHAGVVAEYSKTVGMASCGERRG